MVGHGLAPGPRTVLTTDDRLKEFSLPHELSELERWPCHWGISPVKLRVPFHAFFPAPGAFYGPDCTENRPQRGEIRTLRMGFRSVWTREQDWLFTLSQPSDEKQVLFLLIFFYFLLSLFSTLLQSPMIPGRWLLTRRGVGQPTTGEDEVAFLQRLREPSKVLTVADVADRLQVSRSTIYFLVERGKLAHHRVGRGRGTIRFSEADVEDYLQSCRREREAGEAPTAPAVDLRNIKYRGRAPS
jgi:excisionase family DNA binding protein